MVSKDPIKVRAGRMGAAKRWGAEPSIVRLHDLTDAQRRVVLALIEAARSEQRRAALPEAA